MSWVQRGGMGAVEVWFWRVAFVAGVPLVLAIASYLWWNLPGELRGMAGIGEHGQFVATEYQCRTVDHTDYCRWYGGWHSDDGTRREALIYLDRGVKHAGDSVPAVDSGRYPQFFPEGQYGFWDFVIVLWRPVVTSLFLMALLFCTWMVWQRKR